MKLLGEREQDDWRRAIMRARSDDPNLKFAKASAKVVRDAWKERFGFFTPPAVDKPAEKSPPVAVAPVQPTFGDKRWCEQCERLQTLTAATVCKDRFCKLRPRMRA